MHPDVITRRRRTPEPRRRDEWTPPPPTRAGGSAETRRANVRNRRARRVSSVPVVSSVATIGGASNDGWVR